MEIRLARAEDLNGIVGVLTAAFPTDAEARLVQQIIADGHDELSLVAVQDDVVVGHVLFSPVTVTSNGAIVATGLGLAPLAVSPAHQRQGVGSALVTAALQSLEVSGCPFVVVLGEPHYYQRFGFAKASDLRLQNEYGVDEHFMVAELTPPALPPDGGLVKYAPAFASL